VELADVDMSFDNHVEYNRLMVAELESSGDALPSDPRLAVSYLDSGVVYAFKRNYEECIRRSQRVIELSRGIPDNTKAVNLRSLAGANLAMGLLYTSRTEEALPIAEATLAEREAHLGVNDRISLV
jgi:hypothetical protein